MWRNLVVYLTDTRSAAELLAVGTELAALVQGRLRGLFIKRLPLLEYSLMPPAPDLTAPPPALYDPEMLAEMEAQQEQTAKELAAILAQQAGPAALGLEVAAGLVIDELLRVSHSTDLLVMGRQEGAFGEGGRLGDTVTAVLKQSWAPVWLPAAPGAAPVKGPVLVAYDGSQAANRVLRQVAGWSAKVKVPVTIAVIGPEEETADLLAEAQQYLLPYEIPLSLVSRPGKPTPGLAALVAEGNFSLIALGAHGHSKLKDFLLGTTTETLVAQHPKHHFLIYA